MQSTLGFPSLDVAVVPSKGSHQFTLSCCLYIKRGHHEWISTKTIVCAAWCVMRNNVYILLLRLSKSTNVRKKPRHTRKKQTRKKEKANKQKKETLVEADQTATAVDLKPWFTVIQVQAVKPTNLKLQLQFEAVMKMVDLPLNIRLSASGSALVWDKWTFVCPLHSCFCTKWTVLKRSHLFKSRPDIKSAGRTWSHRVINTCRRKYHPGNGKWQREHSIS